MRHDDAVERLSEYRDGALSAAERSEVSRHLAGCASCEAILSDWERLAKAFLRRSAAPTVFQTEAFVARAMSRLPDAVPAPLAWLSRWLVPALGLSLTALAFSFRPYPGLEVQDPAAALLADADRGASPVFSRPEPVGADVLGFGPEDR